MSGYLHFHAQHPELSKIADALERAGNGFHNTNQWQDSEDYFDGKSACEVVQDAFDAADKALAECVHQVNRELSEPSAAELRHRLSDMCHEYELVAGKLITATATLNLIAKWGNPDAETELPAMAARLVLTKIGEAPDSQFVACTKQEPTI